MSVNARGAYAPIKAIVGADVVKSCAVTADGSARDITGATLTVIVKNNSDPSGYGVRGSQSTSSHAQTITDAANGLFTLHIPKSAYADKEGEEMSWQLVMTENGKDTCLAYGPLELVETL